MKIELDETEIEEEKGDVIEFDDDGDDGDAIDADFSEVIERPKPIVADGDGEAPIAAEPSRVDFRVEDPEPDPLESFLAGLPKETDVTIVVKRKPDRGNSFRLPCDRFGLVENIYWNNRPIEDIYTEIQRTHGGGVYMFQLQYDGGLRQSWSCTILDPASPSEAERTIAEKKAKDDEPKRSADTSPMFAPGPATPAGDPIDAMLAEVARVNRLRDLLAPAAADPSGEQLAVNDQLKLKIFDRLSDKPEFADKLTNLAFGILEKGEKKEKETWVDVAKEAIKHPAEVMQLIGGIVSFGSTLFGYGGPAPSAQAVRSATIVMPPASPPAAIVMPPGLTTGSEPEKAASEPPAARIEAKQAVAW